VYIHHPRTHGPFEETRYMGVNKESLFNSPPFYAKTNELHTDPSMMFSLPSETKTNIYFDLCQTAIKEGFSIFSFELINHFHPAIS